MSFILSAQRAGPHRATGIAFERYRQYLASIGDALPSGARGLATSSWYFDQSDHRCPHDARLENVAIAETGDSLSAQKRTVSINVRLLAAYHDGYIRFHYRNVLRYDLEFTEPKGSASFGHRDWLYDEFRISKHGRVEHEIEWSGPSRTGLWLIEAADVDFRWIPIDDA
jgi:hypothetical protein